MTNALAIALRQHREATGLSVRKAADVLGLSVGYLSQLETGKITLPSAHTRRRIAQWLGVSHLDVLLLTGEITESEIADAGKTGIVEANPDDPTTELCALLKAVNWYGFPDRVRYVRALVQEMIDWDCATASSSVATTTGT